MPSFIDQFMFELMALFVGSYQYLAQTAAHIAFSNIVMINGSLINGYATTVMAKAGHLIGMNNATELRHLIRRGLIIAVISIYCFFATLFIFKKNIF